MSERRIVARRFKWELFGAALSFVAAVLTSLLGILLTTSWIVIPALHPQLRGFGILFLIVALPLLICGGHCLDLLERRGKREREATLQTPERGNVTVSCIVAAVILLGLAFMAPLELSAQQTIFNVPTTDVLDRGTIWLQPPRRALIHTSLRRRQGFKSHGLRVSGVFLKTNCADSSQHIRKDASSVFSANRE